MTLTMLNGRAALALFCLAASCGAAAAAPRTSATVAEFVDFVGINTHFGAVGSPYGDVPQVAKTLDYLGIRHIRDSIGGAFGPVTGEFSDGSPDGKLRIVDQAGIKTLVSVGYNMDDNRTKLMALAPHLDAVEGPNEPDVHEVAYGRYSGPAAGAAAQKDLYKLMKSEPTLKDKAVLNFPLAHAELSKTVGDLSAYVDYANIHAYADHGAAPFLRIPQKIQHTESTPGRPVMVTETGVAADTPGGPPGARLGPGHSQVTEAVQARYVMDTLLDNFRDNVRRTYLYELFDESQDPQNTDFELHWGAYRADGSPKPLARELHHFMTIINRPSGPAGGARPARLAWSVRQSSTDPAMDAGRFNLLLQKADGGQDLILWAEGPLWSKINTPAPPIRPNRVLVSLGRSYPSVRVFDPLASDTPILNARNVSAVWLNLRDHPLIVEVAAR